MQRAVAIGIRHFDTAELYGNGLNESLIGQALVDVRDQVLIASKGGMRNIGAARIMIGISAQTFSTTANGLVQMTTESHLKGRVQAIMMAVFSGGTPLGAPIVGWVADRFGPRWGSMVAAFGGFGAAAVILYYFLKHRSLRLCIVNGRIQVRLES